MKNNSYYIFIGISCVLTLVSVLAFIIINLQMNMTRDDWNTIIAGTKFFLGFLAIIFSALVMIGGTAFLLYAMSYFSSKNAKQPSYNIKPTFNVGTNENELTNNNNRQLKQSQQKYPFQSPYGLNQSNKNLVEYEDDEGYQILGEGK